MPKRPYKFRELRKKLRDYDVLCDPRRGKGSERIFYKPVEASSKKGPSIPVKCHGEGTEISVPVIEAILRRFDISSEEFWD